MENSIEGLFNLIGRKGWRRYRFDHKESFFCEDSGTKVKFSEVENGILVEVYRKLYFDEPYEMKSSFTVDDYKEILKLVKFSNNTIVVPNDIQRLYEVLDKTNTFDFQLCNKTDSEAVDETITCLRRNDDDKVYIKYDDPADSIKVFNDDLTIDFDLNHSSARMCYIFDILLLCDIYLKCEIGGDFIDVKPAVIF